MTSVHFQQRAGLSQMWQSTGLAGKSHRFARGLLQDHTANPTRSSQGAEFRAELRWPNLIAAELGTEPPARHAVRYGGRSYPGRAARRQPRERAGRGRRLSARPERRFADYRLAGEAGVRQTAGTRRSEPAEQQVDPHSSACVVGAADRRQDRYDAVSDQHSLRLAIQRSLPIMSRHPYFGDGCGNPGRRSRDCRDLLDRDPGVDRGGLSRFLRAPAKALGVTLGRRMSDLRRCWAARTCARSSRMRRWR
jgi:hypothetical protein